MLSITVTTVLFIQRNNKYIKTIKYALKDSGKYYGIDYKTDNDKRTISYYIECDSDLDFSKVARQLEEYVYTLKQFALDQYDVIEVDFINDYTKEGYISFSNLAYNGEVLKKFSVAIVGSYYRFCSDPSKKQFDYFSDLELGKGVELPEIKCIISFFENLKSISCYSNDEDFEDIKRYVKVHLPECEVINLS